MEEFNKKEYQEFLEKHEKGHYAQSLEWANVKDEWKNEIIIVRDNSGKIKASMSVLIRKLPYIKSTLMYSPRGPVCDVNDEKSFKELIKKADELAKKYNAFMLKMDPDILASNIEFKKMAKERGFKVEDKIKDVNTLLQPRYVFRLDIKGKTEDEIFNSFHSKTRYNNNSTPNNEFIESLLEKFPKLKVVVPRLGDTQGISYRRVKRCKTN